MAGVNSRKLNMEMDQKGFRCKILVKGVQLNYCKNPLGVCLLDSKKNKQKKPIPSVSVCCRLYTLIPCWQVKERIGLRRTWLGRSSGYSHDYLLQL